ncbi:MAG: DUF2807 domain-containing protein [Chitinophagaceae bacterium]|nr:MAG: DUF2807 domain-containing protein [Chitinophagaceae bacterium]
MRYFLIALATVVLFSSCRLFGGKRVSGNGKIVTQEQNVNSFHSIEVSGAATVRLKQDSIPSVRIETDENLFEYLDVHVDGNTLVIEPKKGVNLHPSKEIIVYATAAQFRNIDASGACNIISDNLLSSNQELKIEASGSTNINIQVTLPKLTTDVSGSGEVTLKGMAKEFSGSISGSGAIKGFDLITDKTELDLSGAADAQITANEKLDIEVSGSGDVEYKGNANVNQRISGSGSVKKVN